MNRITDERMSAKQFMGEWAGQDEILTRTGPGTLYSPPAVPASTSRAHTPGASPIVKMLEGVILYLPVDEREPWPDGDEAGLVKRARERVEGIHGGFYTFSVIGQRKARGSGTTLAYPDISIRSSRWPKAVAVLIEGKTAKGAVKPEQGDLEAAGGSYICRSVKEILEALLNTERAFEIMLSFGGYGQ